MSGQKEPEYQSDAGSSLVTKNNAVYIDEIEKIDVVGSYYDAETLKVKARFLVKEAGNLAWVKGTLLITLEDFVDLQDGINKYLEKLEPRGMSEGGVYED